MDGNNKPKPVIKDIMTDLEMIYCYEYLGYETHDCLFCPHHGYCQELRRKRGIQ